MLELNFLSHPRKAAAGNKFRLQPLPTVICLLFALFGLWHMGCLVVCEDIAIYD
jgi:hypothetical protein